MKDLWTLQQYIDELRRLAEISYEDVVHKELIELRVKSLKYEMKQLFSDDEIFSYGVILDD